MTYHFDRIVEPEKQLYTLTNIHTGEEYIVSIEDMKQTIYSDLDILKMKTARHPDFILCEYEPQSNFKNVEMGLLL